MNIDDHLSRSIILRRRENQNQNKIKISILREKICSIIMRKYNDIFIKNKLSKDQLNKDIEFLTNNIELDNLLFDRLVLEIERIILIKTVKGCKLVPEDNNLVIKNSKPYLKSAIKVNKSVDFTQNLGEISKKIQMNTNIAPEENVQQVPSSFEETRITKNNNLLNSSFSPILKTGLLEKLQYNQQEDWGLIAKYNYLKEQEDKKLRKEKQRSLNSEVFRGLQLQIIEKSKIKKEEADKEKQFNRDQQERLKKLKNEEDYKKEKIKEGFKKEKEIRDNLFRMNVEKRKIEKERELNQDKIFIESVRKGLLEEENLKKVKKEREKLLNKEIADSGEKNMNEKMSINEKEKMQMRKEFKECYDIMEKKEIERDLMQKIKKERIKSLITRYDHLKGLKEMEKKIESINNEKIEKDKLKIELQELEKIKQEKEKKEIMKKDLYNSLTKQIEEKKIKLTNEKKIDEEFDKETLQDIENYRKKQTEKEELMKLTFTKHKEVLKKQLEEKTSLHKNNPKEEKEFILSRDLIKSIKSSPLLQKASQF